ncbi:MAG: adenosylcobinamide-GDP ribazoletransferase [Brachymonas sp.]|nr:adenosylcobinamide-GDP ribazoletransferase [Brachymonas sp.]
MFIKHFLLAIQFFTRIPITGKLAAWVGYNPEMLKSSAAHFAGVGWVVGAVAAGVYVALESIISSPYAPLIAACFSTIATVLLTGGFHEDGLADLADGLGGSYDRNRALEIMKDSRVGAFGAMALVLALLTKIALLAALGELPLMHVALLIWASHCVSRALPMLTVALLPHVGDAAGSKSKPLADRISRSALWSNFLWCFIPLAGIYTAWNAIELIVIVGCSVVAWGIMQWRLKQRLQGFTGDALGATQQVCEIAFLLGAVAVGL